MVLPSMGAPAREGPFPRCRSRIEQLRDVMQDEQIRARAGRDRVGTTLVVAELHEQSFFVKPFDDGADLPACEPLCGKVGRAIRHIQNGRPLVLCVLFRFHHSTQHVTNLGTLSPVRTIQIVLTTALFPCRLMVASRRQCVPQASTANRGGLAGACGFKQNVSQPCCVAALKIEGLAEYPSLVPTARVRGAQAIVLDLADIKDRSIAMRQIPRHHVHADFIPGSIQRMHERDLWRWAVLSSRTPAQGTGSSVANCGNDSEYQDIEIAFRRADHSATAKQHCQSSSAMAR